MPAEQQIITIDDISADNAPAIYVAGGLSQFLKAVTTEVTAEVPEWLALRLGIVTCSELDTLLVNGKGEAGLGAGAFTYMDIPLQRHRNAPNE